VGFFYSSKFLLTPVDLNFPRQPAKVVGRESQLGNSATTDIHMGFLALDAAVPIVIAMLATLPPAHVRLLLSYAILPLSYCTPCSVCKANERAFLSRNQRRPINRLGQTPIDHQRFAIRAQHDVARIQIAVQYAPTVGVGHGIAHVHEPAQQ